MSGEVTYREKALIERLAQYLGVLENSSFEYPNPPDAIMDRLGRRYSIELREFMDRPKAHSEGVRSDIVREANRLYVNAGLALVDVQVLWGASINSATPKQIRSQISRDLFELVRSNAPAKEGSIHIDQDIVHEMKASSLQTTLHSVRIDRYDGQKRGHWISAEAGFVPFVEVDEIQNIIDGKVAKLSGYQTNVDEVWLLIPIGWGGPASFGQIQEGVLTHTYSAPFDKVFLMPWGKAHSLKIQA